MSSVKYTPGNEPQELKLKLQRFFAKVDEEYPNKVISGFYKNHKAWGEQMTALRRALGYEDNNAFWEAYGYKVEVVVQGVTAPKTAADYQVVIDELKKRYEGRTCPAMNRLSIENPDLSGKIKTLQNKAPTVFGMTLKEKLVSEGVLAETPRAQSSIEVPQKTQEERFEEIIQTLKDRYVDSEEKPSSLAELKVVNRDLSLGQQFFSYIKNKYGKKTEEYFVEIGVISNKKSILKCFDNTDFDISPRGILRKYNGRSKVMIIPYGVKKIDKKVFGVEWEVRAAKAKFIEEIIIPDSVEIIDAQVFRDLTKLKKVKLSKNLRIIEEALFCNCTALCEVEIPEGVEVINSLAFFKCNLSGKISIPSTVKTINQNPWKETKNLEGFIVDTKNENYTSVDGVLYNKEKTELCMYPLGKMDTEFVVPDGVEKLRAGAFSYCEKLESIKIPYSVNEIGENCFSHCIRLKNIVVPETATILNNAFEGCTALAKDGFIIINGVSYGHTSRKAEKVVVPDGVKVVKEWAILSEHKNIYIPDSVEYVYNIPYGVEYLSVPSTLKNFDELKKMVGSRVRIVTRLNKNDNEYKKYYTMPSLEEFTGKGILLDILDEQLKTEARAILKRFNASIKRVFSKNVDYVITEDVFAYNRRRKHSEFVEASLSNTDKTGVPMLIILDEILIENEKYIERQFVSMPKEAKLNYALSLYKVCINKVQTMMDNVGTYGEPICSELAEIKETLYPSVNVSDAYDFLNEVAKVNESWGDPHEEIAESYRYMYEKAFSENGYDLAECIGIEAAIAIAVACFVFGSPDCNIHIEWVRDKWESRGDYSSSFNVGFELSKVFAEGRVVRCGKEAYDM